MATNKVYARLPLPSTSPHLRILYLHKAEDYDAPIECRLVVRPMPAFIPAMYHFEHAFEALSYTWGDKISKSGIILEGAPVSITENLELFLRHRRSGEEDVALWVDAICINQDDTSEKDGQIPLMSTIYILALRTTIWLGPASEDSDTAMCCLHQLGTGSPYDKMPRLTHATLTALQRLMRRPWWTRIWIIQEVVSGGSYMKLLNLTVWCGKSWTPWMNVVIAAARMKCHQDDQRQYFPNIDSILELEALRDGFLDTSGLSLPANVGTSISLANLLGRCRRFSSSNLRDKIYALQSLMTNQMSDLPKPRYGASVEDVYMDLATHEYCHGRLRLLRHCGTAEHNIPSWVPDWSINPGTTPLRVQGDCQYLDVPWWSEPADPRPADTEKPELTRHLFDLRQYLRLGYSYRGYHFRGCPRTKEQAVAERNMRLGRLRLATEGLEIVESSIRPRTTSEANQGFGGLLPSDNAWIFCARQKYQFGSGGCTAGSHGDRTVTAGHVGLDFVKQGEAITEQRQKTHIYRALAMDQHSYTAGFFADSLDVVPRPKVDRMKKTITVQLVPWDYVDTINHDPFPNDIDANWEDATSFMVAVGQCKAIALNRGSCCPPASRLFQHKHQVLEAFWSTIFVGQLGFPDKFYPNEHDRAKMTYMDWLPEINDSWKPGPVELTPITSGLLELAQCTRLQQQAIDVMLGPGTVYVQELWAGSASNAVFDEFGKDSHDFAFYRSREMDSEQDHSKKHTNLAPSEWTADQIRHYKQRFEYLASRWHEQPYDLYHRPFSMLNVVPDPYWECRKRLDKEALRNTRTDRPMPNMGTPDKTAIPASIMLDTDVLIEKQKQALHSEPSMRPSKTLEPGFEKYALGRRFFVTRKGCFGLGPEGVLPGDRVVVVTGLDVPLVIRRHGPESGLRGWRVVGEAYVYGIMDGEVLQDVEAGKLDASEVQFR